jgi:flagellar protein FlgJ
MSGVISLSTPASVLLDTATAIKPSNIQDAAKQFEALMIGQMLRSVREAVQDEGSDSSGATMMDLADQHFSQLLANHGGLGLAQMIVKDLSKE